MQMQNMIRREAGGDTQADAVNEWLLEVAEKGVIGVREWLNDKREDGDVGRRGCINPLASMDETLKCPVEVIEVSGATTRSEFFGLSPECLVRERALAVEPDDSTIVSERLGCEDVYCYSY
jgi:hypothetical protein